MVFLGTRHAVTKCTRSTSGHRGTPLQAEPGLDYELQSAHARSALDHTGLSPSRLWPHRPLAAWSMFCGLWPARPCTGWPFPDRNGSCHSLLPPRPASPPCCWLPGQPLSVVPDLRSHLPAVLMLYIAPETLVRLPVQLRLDIVPRRQSDSSSHRGPHLVTQAALLLAQTRVIDLQALRTGP